MKVGDKIKCIKERSFGMRVDCCHIGDMYVILETNKIFNSGDIYCVIAKIYDGGMKKSLSFFEKKEEYVNNNDRDYQYVYYIWDYFESKTAKARRIIEEYEKR